MQISKTRINGVYHITPKFHEDERGMFAVLYEKATNDLNYSVIEKNWVQTSIAFNKYRGTFRGLHYQHDPHSQAKLIRCTRGAIHDVAVDLRPDSPTFKEYYGAFLTEDNRESIYIPRGFAHGYVTLEDASEVEYMVDDHYYPELSGGYRYNDPSINIKWMCEPSIMNDRDVMWSFMGD